MAVISNYLSNTVVAGNDNIYVSGKSSSDLIGKGVYQFEEKTGVIDAPINVYYFLPTTWNIGDDIAFVMHGVNRDAERYLEDWITYANEKNILVICPEFSNEKYPGSEYYNTGNIMHNGKLQDKEDWVFSAIDRMVDDVKTKFKSSNSKTLLYGHSAGAQMVHRYAIFNDNTNFDLIVPANAGWYTMPDDTISFPYGVGGVPISNEEWRTIFSKPLVVLLGEEDTVRDSNLRVTAEADAQGENRFERGKTFYEKMANKAKALGFEFNWKLSTVPEIGHSDYRMAKPALEIFSETSQSILRLDNSTKSPVTVSADVKVIDAAKRTSAVKITGNTLANTIRGGSGADSIFGGGGNDSILGNAGNDKLFGEDGNDTLDGGNGNDTLTGGAGNDVFIYSAGKDVIADYATGDKISIGAAISKSTVSGSNVVLTIGSGTLTVNNAKGKTLSMIDAKGKSFSTVVGNDTLTVTNSTKSPVTIGSAIKTVDASKRTSAVKITGNTLANTISGGSKNDSLYGAAGNDSILGNAGNDKLFGDAGNDTLHGSAGNDTLTGGAGNDVFIYSAGKDVIADYATGDKISIGAAISKSTVSGSNVVLTIGSGTLTVNDAKGKSLSMIDAAGKSFSTVVGTSDTLTVSNSTKSPVNIGADVKTVDASKRTSAVKITGNSLANTISGGSKNDSLYGAAGNDSILGNAGNDKLFGDAGNDILRGGAGNDTLTGGKGNDSLWGDAGKDTFLYSNGDGKDVIFGFENNDLLQITGVFSASYNKSKKEVAFKVGSTASAITLRDFTATSFHVNGDTYSISNNKFIKK